MTLIIAKVTEDAIVMMSDGLALDDKSEEVLTNKARKIFHIKDGIHWGIAGKGIFSGEPEHLASYLELLFKDLVPPYSMQSVTKAFQSTMQTYFSEAPFPRPNLTIDVVIAGYSRDEQGKPIKPIIYMLGSNENWDAAPSVDATLIGKIDEKYKLRFGMIPEKTEEAITFIEKIIRDVEKEEISVGGVIKTVIIKDTDKNKFKELIKYAPTAILKNSGKK